MARRDERAMKQLHELAKKFPANQVFKNPAGFGDYVPHGLVVQRLLKVCGPFSMTIERELRGDYRDLKDVIVGVIVTMTVEIDGRNVSISEVGDCENPANWPHDGARLKDAVSDAVKRCCARIGLGLHLWVGDQYDLDELGNRGK
jgi:hypothetical protein